MTNEEILKNNRLIAEFMGLIPATKDSGVLNWDKLYIDNNGILVSITQLDYHKSWDKLMPVCQKIESKESIILCEMNGIKDSFTPYLNKTQAMKNGAIRFDLEKTYKGVIEFIKWYNENKQH